MTTSPIEARHAWAQQVRVETETLVVELGDGRVLTVPLTWFPRLRAGSPQERSNWRLIGRGEGVAWPDLDEDISIASLLAGHPSTETQSSLKRWLAERAS